LISEALGGSSRDGNTFILPLSKFWASLAVPSSRKRTSYQICVGYRN
jgi:hypothetical protein